jgi:hypothetical protein
MVPGLFGLCLLLCGCEADTMSVPFTPGAGDPVLNVSTLNLAFDANDMQHDLVITNAGGDTLEWNLSAYPNWIEPSADSGAVLYASSVSVAFQLQRYLLDPGTHAGEIHLASNGGDTTISVSALQLDAPVLGDLPDTLDFGQLETQVDLIIYNAGSDTIFWHASLYDPLFSLSLDSGQTVQQTPLTVTFDRNNAPPEMISATLVVETATESDTVTLMADNSWQAGEWLSHIALAANYYSARAEDYFYIVRFDVPDDLSDYVIDSVRACFTTFPGVFDEIQFLCWDVGVDMFGNLVPNLDMLYYGTGNLDPDNGWNTWAVDWPLQLEMFCIGYLQENATPFPYPKPYYDSTVWGQYSYLIWEDAFGNLYIEFVLGWEWCIEVHVKPEQPGLINATGGRWIRSQSLPVCSYPYKPTAASVMYSRPSPG